MKRIGPKTKPCGTPQVRGDEGELCGGIPTVDVRDERYDVNHGLFYTPFSCQNIVLVTLKNLILNTEVTVYMIAQTCVGDISKF